MDNTSIVLHQSDSLTTVKPVLQFSAICRHIERFDTKRSRLYVHVEDENMLENLQNRFDRPIKEYKKLLAPVFALLGVDKASWSQRCGCSCGCSPGFVLDRKVFIKDSVFGDDLFVTVKGAPKNDGNPRSLA